MVALLLAFTGVLKVNLGGVQTGGITPATQPQQQVGVGYATAITAGCVNAITGASGVGTTCGISVYADDGSWSITGVNCSTSSCTVSASAPNSLNGYALVGNDANQLTDQGGETYIRKIPVSYSNKGAVRLKDTDGSSDISVYSEPASFTHTCYDDGTAETTCNVTVGTSVVTSTELKVETSANTCFGNLDFNRPLGVCFNESTSGTFDEVRPTNYAGTFSAPEVAKGKNIVGCYILPTDALCDDGIHSQFYRYYVTIDPASDPGVSISVSPMYFDLAWKQDDSMVWNQGWGDDSVKGTDVDVGYSYLDSMVIWMT